LRPIRRARNWVDPVTRSAKRSIYDPELATWTPFGWDAPPPRGPSRDARTLREPAPGPSGPPALTGPAAHLPWPARFPPNRGESNRAEIFTLHRLSQ